MKSIFTEKSRKPTEKDLDEALENTSELWLSIREYVISKYPSATEEWNYPGEKYGWSYRIKDKKRAIIYLLPRDKYFKVAFIFGQKATDKIFQSNISQEIKTELETAKVYAEGRGIRINITDDKILSDIKFLIDVKLMF